MPARRRSRLPLLTGPALLAGVVLLLLLRPTGSSPGAGDQAVEPTPGDAGAPAVEPVAPEPRAADRPLDRASVAAEVEADDGRPRTPGADGSNAVRGRLEWAGRPLSTEPEGAPCTIDGTLHLERLPRDDRSSPARSVPVEGGRFELPHALFDAPAVRLRVVRVESTSGAPVFACDDPPIGPTAADVAVRVADRAGLFVYSEVEGRFLGEACVAVADEAMGRPEPVGAIPAPRDAARALAAPRPTPLESGELALLSSVFVGAPGHAWRAWRAEATWPPRPEVIRLGPGGDLHLEGPGLAEGLRTGDLAGYRIELTGIVDGAGTSGSPEHVWTVRGRDLAPSGRVELTGIAPGPRELTLYRLDGNVLPVGATRHRVTIEAGAVTVLGVEPTAAREELRLEFARAADRARLTGLRFGLESRAEPVEPPRPAEGQRAPTTLALRPDRDLTSLEHLTLEPFGLTFDIRRAACWTDGRLTLRVPPIEPVELAIVLDGAPVRPTAFGAAAFLDCGGGPAAPTLVPELAPLGDAAPRLDRVPDATRFIGIEVDGRRLFERVAAERIADGVLRLHSRLPVRLRLERHGLEAGRSLDWWAALRAVDASGTDCADVRVTRTEPLGGRSPFTDARSPIEAATLEVPANAAALVAPDDVRLELPADWTRGDPPSLVLEL